VGGLQCLSQAEFEQQRNAAQQTGQQPDPRLARIQRLKAELETVRQRLNTKNAELANLKQLQSRA
jgi:molecular chaperone GrpE (heat shock protein)